MVIENAPKNIKDPYAIAELKDSDDDNNNVEPESDMSEKEKKEYELACI